MPPIDSIPVTSITESHLRDLVAARVPEGKTIEYKRELKIGNDSEKREFCVDLTSFANAAGGLMLFGVRAENGEAAELVGIPIPNVDAQITTIEQIINWGISPRLPWFDTHPVKLTGGGYILAIKIPRSAISPHAHAKDGVCRFFTRGTKGKLPMDIPQVRASFQLSDTLRDRLRNYRAERTARIIAGAGAAQVNGERKLICHVVPLSALADSVEYDIRPFHQQRNELAVLHSEYPSIRRYNLDGLLGTDTWGNPPNPVAYVQLHRNGIIESVDATVLDPRMDLTDRMVSATYAQGRLIPSIFRYLTILREIKVSPPVYVMVTMTGVRDTGMRTWNDMINVAPARCDRDELIFQEIVVDQLDANPEVFLKPMFDALWSAYGMERCLHYQEDGTFKMP